MLDKVLESCSTIFALELEDGDMERPLRDLGLSEYQLLPLMFDLEENLGMLIPDEHFVQGDDGMSPTLWINRSLQSLLDFLDNL